MRLLNGEKERDARCRKDPNRWRTKSVAQREREGRLERATRDAPIVLVDQRGVPGRKQLREFVPEHILARVLGAVPDAWDLDSVIGVHEHDRAILDRSPCPLEGGTSLPRIVAKELVDVARVREE